MLFNKLFAEKVCFATFPCFTCSENNSYTMAILASWLIYLNSFFLYLLFCTDNCIKKKNKKSRNAVLIVSNSFFAPKFIFLDLTFKEISQLNVEFKRYYIIHSFYLLGVRTEGNKWYLKNKYLVFISLKTI